LNWIDHQPFAFAQFLSFVCDEAVDENFFWELKAGGKQQRTPDDTMMPTYVFAYQMYIGGPKFLEFVGRVTYRGKVID
jgi:hypothetical protein